MGESATIYQPFLDYGIQLLGQRQNLEAYPIPAGFESNQAQVGQGARQSTVLTTSHGYRSPRLRQIRAAHVQGGESLQVLNFVIFPHLNYDLPFFGADLVTLPGGHLIAIDMQPLFREEPAYQAKYAQPILPLLAKYQADLPWGGDFPAEAQQFFSPAFLWTRSKSEQDVKTHVWAAFKDYLHAYLDFVDRAEPVTDTQRLAEIQAAHLAYIRYRAEKDPARGMLTRFYGADWTEEYIHGFLFDLERQLALGAKL
jgi:phycoerythrobilin:ferredoxin oxidoreductase